MVAGDYRIGNTRSPDDGHCIPRVLPLRSVVVIINYVPQVRRENNIFRLGVIGYPLGLLIKYFRITFRVKLRIRQYGDREVIPGLRIAAILDENGFDRDIGSDVKVGSGIGSGAVTPACEVKTAIRHGSYRCAAGAGSYCLR